MTEYNKNNPFHAKILKRELLSQERSTKRTYHLTLDLTGSNLSYKPGDAVAIFPENPEEEVNALLNVLKLEGDEMVIDPRSGGTWKVRHFFQKKVNLLRIPTPLMTLSGDPLLQNDKMARLDFASQYDLIDFFELFPFTPPLQELVSYLSPLLPRFYSIASSPLIAPNCIDLLIATFTYSHGNKVRQGLGSHFLTESAEIGHTAIPLYLHPTTHFTLPEEAHAPLIMVGPGTGVAPYRSFLWQRKILNSRGKNWLFFGERNRASDFYYQDEFEQFVEEKFLQLDLAFSRDQEEKVYVQHLLSQKGALIWEWLQNGAYFYICGDARRMSKDVLSTLNSLIEKEGGTNPIEYLKGLRQEKRLLLDVY